MSTPPAGRPFPPSSFWIRLRDRLQSATSLRGLQVMARSTRTASGGISLGVPKPNWHMRASHWLSLKPDFLPFGGFRPSVREENTVEKPSMVAPVKASVSFQRYEPRDRLLLQILRAVMLRLGSA